MKPAGEISEVRFGAQYARRKLPEGVSSSRREEAIATPEQPASAWTRISCSSTLELINFSAFNQFRLKAG